MPGFSPSTEAQTNFAQTLRGRFFQTLIDGVPQDTPLRNGERSLQSVDIDAIEQIEIIRGGTAIYGFGADGGLINYITKRPEDGEFNASARTGISFSTVNPDDSIIWNTNLQTSGRPGAVDYLLSGTFVNRNGSFDADGNRRPTDPVGAQGGLDESDEYNVLAKLGYQLDQNQRLQANFNFYSLKQVPDFGDRLSAGTLADFGPPTVPEIALPGNFQDANPGNEAMTGYLTYTHDDVFGSSIEVQGYYQQIDTIFTLFPGFAQTQIESEKFGLRLTGNTPVELGALPFEVTWGVDYLSDDTGQFEIVGDADPRGDKDAIAGFAQVEVPLGDLAIITAGVRHENVSIDITGIDPAGEASGSETLFNASTSIFLTRNFTLFGGFSQSFSPGDILRVITDGSFATIDEVELEFVRTGIPPEKVTAYVNYARLDWWGLNAQVFYSGTQSNDSTAFGGGVEIDDYVLVDLHSTFDVGPGQLSVGVTNLLNNAYLPVINQAFYSQFSNVQGPERRISFGCRVSF